MTDIGVKILDKDTKFEKKLKSNLYKYKNNFKNYSFDEEGSPRYFFTINQKVVNQYEIDHDTDMIEISQKNRVTVSENVIITEDYLLNINKKKQIDIFRIKDFKKIDIGILEEKKISQITCLQKLPTLNNVNRSLFIVCDKSKIYIINPIGLTAQITEITTNFKDYSHLKSFLFGSIADYTQDGIDDIWLSNTLYKDKDGNVVGYLGLLDGKSLIDLQKNNFTETNINKIIKKEIVGSSNIPNSETSGIYKATTGIGYSLSTFGGDHDNDGQKDLVILSHYSYGLAGSLHIISGKKITKFQKKIILNDNNSKVVIGSFLGYLGPGVFTGYDFDQDGYDDIIVGADVDHEAGYASGGVYILSGKKIFN